MAASQSRRYHFISDLDPSKDTWRLRVRVIRLYSVPSWLNKKEINRIEMVFLDQKNDKIQASFNDRLIRVFQPLIREGELYSISNFLVSENKDNHKACSNKWKINFHKNTGIRGCTGLDIPKFGLDLVSFEDISKQRPTPNVFIDVIGILKGKSPVQIGGEADTPTKKMTIRLMDECARILEILLWGDYVDALTNYLATHTGRVVVIMQSAKCKYLDGQSYVSNSFYTARLLLNVECDAVTSFLARFEKSGESNEYLIEELNVGRSMTINEEFSQITSRKYIADFLKIREPCVCAVAGTIVKLETQHDWSYPSCNSCTITKVSQQGNSTFYCPKCKKTQKYVGTRFKIVYKIEDETGATSCVMFCREMLQLIGKTALQLKDDLLKNDEDGLFPLELDEVLQKQYLFKLSISDYNCANNYKVYTVARISDDPDLLSAHYALLQKDEFMQATDDTESAGISLPTSLYNDSYTTSLFGENSQMASSEPSSITPTKRGIEEVVAGELYILSEEGQSSAVKPKVTPKVTVKVEKDD